MKTRLVKEEFLADPLDDVIKGAMRGRAAPAAGIDVAGEAIARGRVLAVNAERVARLARLRWWMRGATAAAGLLVLGTIGLGYEYWPADVSGDTSSVDTTTWSVTWDMTTVGVAVLVVTLIGVVGVMVFSPERRVVRLGV